MVVKWFFCFSGFYIYFLCFFVVLAVWFMGWWSNTFPLPLKRWLEKGKEKRRKTAEYKMISEIEARITNTDLSAKDVYTNYSHLWMIENAFRIAKSKLEICPMFHFTGKCIEAHIWICFVAYKVYKELDRSLHQFSSDIFPDKTCTIVIYLPNINQTI